MTYTRKRVSELTGINIETIIYYEKCGLIEEPERDINNYRIYRDEHIDTLKYINICKKIGFTKSEIKTYLEAYRSRDQERIKELSNIGIMDKVKEIEDKIKELTDIKNTLLSIHRDKLDCNKLPKRFKS